MSNIYIQEPPTNGKVLLNTSVGDIDIELWSKEAPKACRNFVQLCLEGYYDNTIFHRIVKGFCVQGGDPTGTGSGGDSIYGEPFKNEAHQRLRFVRRGLVATANSGQNDNGSQFFFTLGRADELHGKHTIFGKVTGNTIYNMLDMENMEVDQNDFPVYPPKILNTEVLSNPFDDIVPREKVKNVVEESVNKKQKKIKGTKNFSLLSFGEEAEDDEEEVQSLNKKIKIKSSHDVLNDPKLSAVPALEQTENDKSRSVDVLDEEMADSIRRKLKKPKNEEKSLEKSAKDEIEDGKSDKRKELQRESKRLQRELREARKSKQNDEKQEEKKGDDDVKDDELGALKEFRQERKEYLHKKNESIKKKGSGREEQTLQLLSSFMTKLENPEEGNDLSALPDDITDGEVEENEDEGDAWLHHKLIFEEQDRKVKDANVRDEDTFEIFDPRNPINKRRREESKNKQKEKRRR
ncbi:spliceosome-associated protein CWC27 homolog [Xenia sp. Carnegie-2017]|uniref:spliceosome-associated protein CWC27 homolog n=1 Tax=Xenia sp. Carnegie-2017 TaxID=2897299 RepID=UPI001F03EFD8|nr:spliceosome-associated protein CWC27 homolog [Xenia sp. Carnegie-2017]XP_046851510.1 spliceosome-associated protein CWC27 homolog [Xenia sp. Carnegie-2017]